MQNITFRRNETLLSLNLKGECFLGTSLGLAPLGDTCPPIDSKGSHNVEYQVSPHDSKVSPGLAVVRVNLGKEGIGRRHSTIRTRARCVGVLDVSTSPFSISCKVLVAGLRTRRVEGEDFIGAADDIRATDGGGQHS